MHGLIMINHFHKAGGFCVINNININEEIVTTRLELIPYKKEILVSEEVLDYLSIDNRFAYLIKIKNDDSVIGVIKFSALKGTQMKDFNLSYFINEKFRNMGYATESAIYLLESFFGNKLKYMGVKNKIINLKPNIVFAVVKFDNEPSKKLAKKLYFKYFKTKAIQAEKHYLYILDINRYLNYQLDLTFMKFDFLK